MSILLTILKILGITFLILVGILLSALLLVLIIPIRYSVIGIIETKEKRNLIAKVSWLKPLITFTVAFQDKLYWDLNLFGFRLLPKETKKKCPIPADTEKSDMEPDADVSETEKISQTAKTDTADDTAEGNRSLSEKIRMLYDKCTFFLNILNENTTQDYIRKVFQIIGKIIRHVLPVKSKVDLTLGFQDPAMTGNILAVYGMLYPYLGEQVKIQADFENEIIKGDFRIKGRIRIGTLLIFGLRMVLDRRLFRVLNQLKKGGIKNVGK